MTFVLLAAGLVIYVAALRVASVVLSKSAETDQESVSAHEPNRKVSSR